MDSRALGLLALAAPEDTEYPCRRVMNDSRWIGHNGEWGWINLDGTRGPAVGSLLGVTISEEGRAILDGILRFDARP